MAFTLTSFNAQAIPTVGGGPDVATQRYTFKITGLTTDVALDIGNYTGTFWTNAQAAIGKLPSSIAVTYGDLAKGVLEFLKSNEGNLDKAVSVLAPELYGRDYAAAAAGTTYVRALSATTKLPSFTFAANNGVTEITVTVDFALRPTQKARIYQANVQS